MKFSEILYEVADAGKDLPVRVARYLAPGKAEYYEISETYTEDGVLTLVIGKEQIK